MCCTTGVAVVGVGISVAYIGGVDIAGDAITCFDIVSVVFVVWPLQVLPV